MLKTLLGIFGGRALQQVGVPVLVNLRPFDVALQLINATGNSTGVDTFTLQGVVSDWMTDGFEDVINRLGAERFSDFDSVFLTFQENRRLLRSTSNRELQSTFFASYSGVSVWKTTEGSEIPTEGFVASIQLEVTRTADSALLESLQNPSLTNAGLGENVQNVRAQISVGDDDGGDGGGSDGGDDGLDVVIIVAIVVACLAFALLGVTLFLAWRRSQEQKEAYKVGTPRRAAGSPGEQGTGETDLNEDKPPENINGIGYAGSDLGAASSLGGPTSEDLGGGIYPESLISEDISTSLTAYYRGANLSKPGSSSRGNSNNLNDAASISSMESYGYSLDGYQSSIAGGYSNNDAFLNNTEIEPSLTDAPDDSQLDVPTREFQPETAQDPKRDVIEM